MPNITSLFLILAFICFMTGIFSPNTVINWGIPHLKNRKNILVTTGVLVVGCSFLIGLKEQPIISKTEAASSAYDKTIKTDELIEKSIYQVGEVGQLNDVSVEVKNINRGSDSVTVDLLLRNNSDDVLTYNPYQFILKNNAGGSLIPSLDENMTFTAGELEPGEDVSGTLIYSYSLGDEEYWFEYRPVAMNVLASVTFEIESQEELSEVHQRSTTAIGDIVSTNSVEIQVTNVHRLQKTASSTPKKGYEFIKVDLKVKNKSEENMIFLPYHFELSDQVHHKTKPSTTLIETENLLKMKEIASGGMIEGSLIFEVLKQSTDLVLNYLVPSLLSTESIAINLELEHEQNNTLSPSIQLNENWITGTRLEPIELENMKLTVFSYDKVNETSYVKANEHKAFLIIDIELENIDEIARDYSALDFKLLTNNGELLLPSITLIESERDLKSGELAPDESIEGQLIFEINENEDLFSLVYSPSQWKYQQKILIPLS